jgi:DNA-binding beta-propeller fold protein YncE
MIALIALVIMIIPYEIANAQLDNKTKKTSTSKATEDQNQTNPASRGIKIGGNPYAIAVNPKNNTIYVVDKYYKKISFIDDDIDKVTRTVIIPNSKTPALSKYNVTDFSSAIAFDPFNNCYM